MSHTLRQELFREVDGILQAADYTGLSKKSHAWVSMELFQAISDCKGRIYPAPGGGVKCTQCPGWFCY
jgi:hypothetical protein